MAREYDIILESELFDDEYKYSVRDIVDTFPRLCKDKYDIEKLNEKIEQSVAHYVKKTLFDLLTLLFEYVIVQANTILIIFSVL